MPNKIIITDDFDSVLSEISKEYSPNFVRVFKFEDLLLENAKDIIKEAYIAEVRPKAILISALKFGIEAQNSLLKIIEEPPNNIDFIIVAESKNLLLPTIISRMPLINKKSPAKGVNLELDFDKLSLGEILKFIEEKSELERFDKMNKHEFLELLKAIILKSLSKGIKFSQDELEYFYKIYNLASLNTKPHAILTPLLLLILKKLR